MKDLFKAIIGILFSSFLFAFAVLWDNPEGNFDAIFSAIIIAIFSAIIIFAISTIIIGSIAERLHQRKKLRRRKAEIEEAERFHQQKELERKAEIEEFVNNDNYHYVEKFATKYFAYNYSEDDFANLSSLLQAKGCPLEPDILNEILKRAIEKIQYEKFKSHLLQFKSQDKQKIFRYFLERYGENYEEFIKYLKHFFQEQNITFSKSVVEYIEQTKKEMEIEYFEQTLLKSTQKQDYNIDNMDGYEFEKFLVSLFTDMGHKVDHTPASRDQGADLILLKHGEKIAVQAKRCNAPITNKAVQEVVGSINFYKADIGMVVTNNTFTASACELAKANNVKLIDGKTLKRLIEQYC
jgi:restriction system protein